jgi:hypothetical protein
MTAGAIGLAAWVLGALSEAPALEPAAKPAPRLFPEIKPKDGAKPRGKDIDVLGLDAAFVRLRREYLPVVVFYDGGAQHTPSAKDVPSSWRAFLEAPGARRAFEGGLYAEIGDRDLDAPHPPPAAPEKKDKDAAKKPPPEGPAPAPGAVKDAEGAVETTSARLGIVRGTPALVLVDFRERVHRRFARDLPDRSELEKLLKGFVATSRAQAALARKVEKALEESGYAYELGRKRAAVQKVLPFEDPGERRKMDPVLLAEVEALTRKYRDAARAVLDEGDALDRAKKYAEALKVLEKVPLEFPFPDLVRSANQKRGEILRKARLGI